MYCMHFIHTERSSVTAFCVILPMCKINFKLMEIIEIIHVINHRETRMVKD